MNSDPHAKLNLIFFLIFYDIDHFKSHVNDPFDFFNDISLFTIIKADYEIAVTNSANLVSYLKFYRFSLKHSLSNSVKMFLRRFTTA